MHTRVFLHKTLSSVIPQKRLATLILLVSTLLSTKKLSVTELGRGIELPIQERSAIRRSDRFIGNKRFYREKFEVHKTFASLMIANKSKPDIIVDWTGVPHTTHHILRAALAVEGRAITLYEEVHSQPHLENANVHKHFLHRLKKLLPCECRPTLITDGGFHNSWFKQVLDCGWDYVGRIRVGSGKLFCYEGASRWRKLRSVCYRACAVPQWIAQVKLGKRHPLQTNLYLFKGKLSQKCRLNKFGQKRTGCNEADYRKRWHEPWIIATSLKGKHYLQAKRVTKKYQKRMQIEEGIRDLKSSRYGFSFENAHSYKIKRIEILLLIAMIASLLAWLTGWVGEKTKLHYEFQSHSIKTRRVLSFFFLGCRMIKKKISIPIHALLKAITKGIRAAFA